MKKKQNLTAEQLIAQYINDVETIRKLLKQGGVEIASLKLAVLESSMNTGLALLQTAQYRSKTIEYIDHTDYTLPTS